MNRRGSIVMILLASIIALLCFAWPFVLPGELGGSSGLVAVLTIAVTSALIVIAFAALNGELFGARSVAMLGVLTAVGVVMRFLGLGFAGVEPVFVLLILAGRALGPWFGFTLGASVMIVSSFLSGMLGPWTPFQVFAAAWVGLGAGLLPRVRTGWPELFLLSGYGVIASYLFGFVMNSWFWPFAVGGETSISFEPGAAVGENVVRFVTYSLVTSTLTWDTVRATTTVVGICVLGLPILAALRRSSLRTPTSGESQR